jgi:hypothetical protein
MGAGFQRWWRSDEYEREVAEYDRAFPRVISEQTFPSGTRVAVYVYADGHTLTSVIAPGSVAYVDGI